MIYLTMLTQPWKRKFQSRDKYNELFSKLEKHKPQLRFVPERRRMNSGLAQHSPWQQHSAAFALLHPGPRWKIPTQLSLGK